MRRCIAWTMTLAAWASSLSIAPAQTPAARPAPTRGAQPSPKAAPGAPSAAKIPAGSVDPAAQKAKLAADARARGDMDLLLDEWEKQSAKVKSLQVVFERIDKSIKWGSKVSQGTAILKSPDLACLEFKRAVPDAQGKPKLKLNANGQKVIEVEKEPFQRIVCTGKEVIQYEYDEKAMYIYPLDKEARQKALQQGPLPFLFNMKAADAKERYGMTLVPDDKAPNEYRIHVVPKQQIDMKDFKTAEVWLSKETFLPSRLVLMPIGDNELQEFRFTHIAPNASIPDGFFAFTVIKGWKVERNDPATALANQSGKSGQADANAKRIAPQPASRRTK